MTHLAVPSAVDSDDGIVGGPWLDERRPGAAAWALLFGIGLLMAGNGLQASLLGIRASAEGFGLGVTGVVMAGYFAGFLVGPRLTERLLVTVGHIRVFAALASMASSAVLLHLVSVTPPMWTAMRFVFGLCMAGSYVVAESWLNDMATNATRGRLLAVYMVVMMGGLALGQLLLNLADPGGVKLFLVASVLVSMSLVPVALSATSAPPLTVPEPISLRDLYHIVPTGIVVAFWVGTAQGSLMGLGAVYATAAGLAPSQIAVFMAAPMVGGLALQWPVGWSSDRVPRRGVMLVTALAAISCSVAMTSISADSNGAVLVMFLLGGSTFPLYSLAIAHTGDWVDPPQLNGASAVMVRTSGVGALLGPAMTGLFMAVGDPTALFWVVAGAHVVVALYLGYRIVLRDALPLERQRLFAPFPARASAMAANLIRRPLRR